MSFTNLGNAEGSLQVKWNHVLTIFDIVVYVRLDLRFRQDLPFTYMDIDWHNEWIWDPMHGPDWLWIMPRHIATDALQTLTLLKKTWTTSSCCWRCATAENKFRPCPGRAQPEHKCPGLLSWYIPKYWERAGGYNLKEMNLERVITLKPWNTSFGVTKDSL